MPWLCSSCSSRDEMLQELYDAIHKQNRAKIDVRLGSVRWLKKVGDLDTQLDSMSYTLLCRAVIKNDYKTVLLLLKAGANPNIASVAPSSMRYALPLLYAIKFSDIRMVETLLDAGADPNAICLSGVPLLEAVRTKNLDMVKLLINKGANIEVEHYSNTPLISALQLGSDDIVHFLLSCSPKIHHARKGVHPLNIAIQNGNKAMVVKLLNAGVEVKPNSVAFHPMIKAITAQDLSIVSLLIERKIGLQYKNEILEKAVKVADMAILKRVVEIGFSVTELEEHGIMTLCSDVTDIVNFERIYRYLASKGVSLNFLDRKGHSPLTVLEMKRSSSNANMALLLDNGANPNL